MREKYFSNISKLVRNLNLDYVIRLLTTKPFMGLKIKLSPKNIHVTLFNRLSVSNKTRNKTYEKTLIFQNPF